MSVSARPVATHKQILFENYTVFIDSDISRETVRTFKIMERLSNLHSNDIRTCGIEMTLITIARLVQKYEQVQCSRTLSFASSSL